MQGSSFDSKIRKYKVSRKAYNSYLNRCNMKRTLYHIATIAVLLLTSALGAQTAGLSVMDPFAATRPVVGTGNLPLPAPLYYTPAELTVQYLQNRACAREYVLSYDPVPDSLEYPEDNYQLPVSRRSVQ